MNDTSSSFRNITDVALGIFEGRMHVRLLYLCIAMFVMQCVHVLKLSMSPSDLYIGFVHRMRTVFPFLITVTLIPEKQQAFAFSNSTQVRQFDVVTVNNFEHKHND